jgi:hypothetical protein
MNVPDLVGIIVASDPAVRDTPLESACSRASVQELLSACDTLDQFRSRSENLYERARALFFLSAIHRFHLPAALSREKPGSEGLIPFHGYHQLLQRRFEESIETFRAHQSKHGVGDGICSALAAAYQRLAFQTLANQVRRSVRSVRGNQWMFRMGHAGDHPLRIRPELLQRDGEGAFPILREHTAVRMDLTHSAWSDIFFLGMDFPEGARVLNVSVDLGLFHKGEPHAPR